MSAALPQTERATVQSWVGAYRYTGDVARPRSLPELVEVMKLAGQQRRRIRAAGGVHSWAPLFPDPPEAEGTPGRLLVDTARLDEVLDFDVERGVVHVEAGITIEALQRHLERRRPDDRWTLVSPTLFPLPTIGGVVATGSHGTGRDAGCFADGVCELTIVRPGGDVAILREGSPDFEAARVSLGLLGVIYSVRIRVRRQFHVYVDKRAVSFHRAVRDFPGMVAENDHVEIFHWPGADHLWVYLMNETTSDLDAPRPWRELLDDLDTRLQVLLGGRALPWIATRAPRLTPLIHRFANHWFEHERVAVRTATDAFHFQKAYPKAWDMSWAVPTEQAGRAWGDVLTLLSEFADVKLYPVNMVVHCRFIGASRGWLAPNHHPEAGSGSDSGPGEGAGGGSGGFGGEGGQGAPTFCMIEVATARGTPDHLWNGFFAALERRWRAIPGARPHWAKLIQDDEGIAGTYPRLADFRAVRAQYDPDGLMLNEHLSRMLQIPASESTQPAKILRVTKRWRPFAARLF